MTPTETLAPHRGGKTRRIASTLAGSAAAVALALAVGCGGGAGGDGAPSDVDSGARAAASTPSEPTGAGEPVDAASGTSTAATVARAATEVAVHAAPGDPEPADMLAAQTEFGSPRALLVVGEDGEWLQVALPERPNGSTGWIRRDDVELRTVDESISIDTAARTLTLLDAGEPVLTTDIAVGSPGNPTPAGSFYVVDKLDTGDPAGPYGRFALGLSAHSETLTEFAGGDGQVGIHGTNDPSSIGQAVSHGCVRVPPEVAEQLAAVVNLGTPVVVS